MSTARLLMRTIRPMIDTAARFPMGRALLLTNLRAAPWLSSEAEARALRDGFADSPDFWQQLWCAVLMDVPLGLEKIECPVILAQGTVDVMSTPQTLRYFTMIPESRVQPLLRGGRAPHSDVPGAIVGLVGEAARGSLTDPLSCPIRGRHRQQDPVHLPAGSSRRFPDRSARSLASSR